ncbi:MAG: hypothetical protein R3C28_33180 [Pirellulaceae bacterium]|nr:hypothetical protein [Planctomycetales bacterium]
MRRSHRIAGIESFETRYCFDSALAAAVDVASDQAEGELTLPDFTLVDQNETSPSFGQEISPSDFLGEVSAWYFGHAT